jgi:hypothetical protein
LAVSSPEATAFDLVGYPRQAGGLDNVTTVLAELGERLVASALASAAPLSPLAWSQRLGHLLDRLGFAERTGPLRAYVEEHSPKTTGLAVGPPLKGAERDRRWSLALNTTVDVDVDT